MENREFYLGWNADTLRISDMDSQLTILWVAFFLHLISVIFRSQNVTNTVCLWIKPG